MSLHTDIPDLLVNLTGIGAILYARWSYLRLWEDVHAHEASPFIPYVYLLFTLLTFKYGGFLVVYPLLSWAVRSRARAMRAGIFAVAFRRGS